MFSIGIGIGIDWPKISGTGIGWHQGSGIGIGIGWHQSSGIGIGWNFGIGTSLIVGNCIDCDLLARSTAIPVLALRYNTS